MGKLHVDMLIWMEKKTNIFKQPPSPSHSKKYWKMDANPFVKLFIGRGVPKSGPVPEYIMWSCLKNVPHMD